MVCYVLAMGKQQLGLDVVVGYAIKIFWPGLFITSPDHLERPRSLSRPKTQNFDFCVCPSHNALKRNASGKKGKLLCCKFIFDRIKGNLAEIQPKNHQNVQKTHFLQKVSGV